jgi:hypothetical protein
MDHGFKKPPPPVFPRSIRGLDDKENIAMVEGEERRKLIFTDSCFYALYVFKIVCLLYISVEPVIW